MADEKLLEYYEIQTETMKIEWAENSGLAEIRTEDFGKHHIDTSTLDERTTSLLEIAYAIGFARGGQVMHIFNEREDWEGLLSLSEDLVESMTKVEKWLEENG